MTDSVAIREYAAGLMQVQVWPSTAELGQAAAQHTAQVVRACVADRGAARIIIATGNSQLPFVKALAMEQDVPWGAVTIFHMDEYVGMTAEHPASFRRWIAENIVQPLRPAEVHFIDGEAIDAVREARRYEDLLREAPLDLVCMGIGENGHIAFNEPHRADFNDVRWARVISLDQRSREQQVGEGHFPDVGSVPEQAITLTVPALLAARHVQVVAPERRKAEAVLATVTAPVSNACPATILRRQDKATLFLDPESASLLESVNPGNEA